MTLKRVAVDPETVVISRCRLEKSRSRYIERAFSCQRPPQRKFRVSESAALPGIEKEPRAASTGARESALYEELHPAEKLFRGSVLEYGRELAAADTHIDKETVTKQGMINTIENTPEDHITTALRNQFMDVRLQCVAVAKNIYIGTSMADSFRFVLELCSFFKVMRPSLREGEYKRLVSAVLEETDLKLLFLAFIKCMVGGCATVINTATVLTYLLLELDPRSILLCFLKPLLRAVGTRFLSRVLPLTTDFRVGEVASLMLSKLVAHNLISFAESGLIRYSRFLTEAPEAEHLAAGPYEFILKEKIRKSAVGLIFALKFTPQRIKTIQRYVLSVSSDCTSDSNCYLCVFKQPPLLEPNRCDRDYACTISRMLAKYGVKTRLSVRREMSQQSLQHELEQFIENADFESFSRRHRLPLQPDDSISFEEQDRSISVYECDASLLQLSFDVYDRSSDLNFLVFATGSCGEFEINTVKIERWRPSNKLPPPYLTAPRCCYRSKAQERAILRKYGSSRAQPRVQFVKSGVVSLPELTALLSNKREEFAREQLPISAFRDLQRDGDLLFGGYSETVIMIEELQQIGLNIQNYQFPTVAEAAEEICGQMLDGAVHGAKYRSGTLGMLAERLWAECRARSLEALGGSAEGEEK